MIRKELTIEGGFRVQCIVADVLKAKRLRRREILGLQECSVIKQNLKIKMSDICFCSYLLLLNHITTLPNKFFNSCYAKRCIFERKRFEKQLINKLRSPYANTVGTLWILFIVCVFR